MNKDIRSETQKKIMDVRPFVSKWKSVKDWISNFSNFARGVSFWMVEH